jgi:hypothetical protein
LLLSGKLCSPTFALHKGKILQIRQAITWLNKLHYYVYFLAVLASSEEILTSLQN